MKPIGVIREIWRYPVKSMAGERLARADVGRSGVLGDRLWAVRDESEGVITSGKKLPKLMLCSARFAEEPLSDAGPGNVPPVFVTLPGGKEFRSDEADADQKLSDYLGRNVTLSALRPATDRDHYRAGKNSRANMREAFGLAPDEPLPDFSMLPLSLLAELGKYATPRGTYFDAYPLHLLTTATLEELKSRNAKGDFDQRRFRPNVFIETTAEQGYAETRWCGGSLSAGDLVTAVDAPTVRCSMPSRAQPGLSNDPSVMKTVAAEAERCVGVYANIERPGRIAIGDTVSATLRHPSKLEQFGQARATDMKRLILRAAAAALPKK